MSDSNTAVDGRGIREDGVGGNTFTPAKDVEGGIGRLEGFAEDMAHGDGSKLSSALECAFDGIKREPSEVFKMFRVIRWFRCEPPFMNKESIKG